MKKEFRVKRNEDFSKIIARKKSFANSCFIIYKDENQMGHGRVGISVSKKLGNAVTRNKIKRQLRMMIQECFHFDEEVDYIVIVRKRFLDNTYIENKRSANTIANKKLNIRFITDIANVFRILLQNSISSNKNRN